MHPPLPFRNLIQERFILKAQALIAALESAESIPHDTTRGTIRESAISDSIRQILPPGVSTCSGFVTDVNGTITPQLDVVLFRREALAPFLLEGNTALVPFETFGLAIEVKSTLTTERLDGQIKEQIRALSRMEDTAFIPGDGSHEAIAAKLKLTPPRLSIVAYKSDVAIGTMESFMKDNPLVQTITVILGNHGVHLVNGSQAATAGSPVDRVLDFWNLVFYNSLAMLNRQLLPAEAERSLNEERIRVRPDMPQEIFKQLVFAPSLTAYLFPDSVRKT